MAELLAGVVMQAVENVAASNAAVAAAAAAPSASPDDDEGSTAGSGASSGKSSSSSSSSSSSGGETPDKEAELPPQMIPGNADISTTLCAMQVRLPCRPPACLCLVGSCTRTSSSLNTTPCCRRIAPRAV